MHETWHGVAEHACELIFVRAKALVRELDVCIGESEDVLYTIMISGGAMGAEREAGIPWTCLG